MYLLVLLLSILVLDLLPVFASISFTNQASTAGVADPGQSNGAAFGDFDEDGVVDLFTTYSSSIANQFYTRLYVEGFADQSHLISSLRSGQDSFSAVPFDYDSDGDPDVYMINEGGPNRLYQNGGNPRAWLKVDVQGTQSNVDGIGARLSMTSGAQVQTREVNGSAGFSLNSRMAHFGLGSSNRIDSLVVRWPSGRVDRYLDMAANSTLLLVEGRGVTAVPAARTFITWRAVGGKGRVPWCC